jgi:hypothetical protein
MQIFSNQKFRKVKLRSRLFIECMNRIDTHKKEENATQVKIDTHNQFLHVLRLFVFITQVIVCIFFVHGTAGTLSNTLCFKWWFNLFVLFNCTATLRHMVALLSRIVSSKIADVLRWWYCGCQNKWYFSLCLQCLALLPVKYACHYTGLLWLFSPRLLKSIELWNSRVITTLNIKLNVWQSILAR